MSPIWSAHIWLVVADELSNLHLLTPLTGRTLALSPITALHNVNDAASLDEDGDPIYNFHCKPGNGDPSAPIPVGEARNCIYDRAALSCSSSCHDCVVLLLHLPIGEILFARPGDERWTWI
jgi:hypothetical protein